VSSAARRLLVLACAASAGVHAALAPPHWAESTASGAAFGVAAVALAASAIALDRRPLSRLALSTAAALLAGLIGAYCVTRLSALPPLAEHAEPVDGLGLATKLVEGGGLICALVVGQRSARGPQGPLASEKGVRT
jgi:hypothetical protein